jgi:mRNA-degrading endonuclease RelE of RelBE toxin-antitoxin system
MKALITHQFNQSMAQLEPSQQKEVSRLFSMVTSLEKEEVINSPLLTRIKSKDEGIYTFRGRDVRIFCTFDANENIIFLDVTSVANHQFRGMETQEEETALFGKSGDPKAYIAWNEENTIYSFNGKPVAYIDEGNNVYGFNGKHLGWFEDGILWNHQGQRVGFTQKTSPVFTQFEPFKGFKQFKPFKGFKQFAPFKPFKSMTNATTSLIEFLEEGR